MKSKNAKLLKDFVNYCYHHPDERFWQALSNWSKHPYIVICNKPPEDFKEGGFKIEDTYYLEDKNK